LKKLIFVEIEKLYRSPVFFVAPIVLVFYLSLMLFGFEVYAAKNGIDGNKNVISIEDEGRYSGSAVVMFYSSINKMFSNMYGIAVSPTLPSKPLGKEELKEKKLLELEIRKDPVKDYSYFHIMFKNLLHPKPLPSPEYGCGKIKDKIENANKPKTSNRIKNQHQNEPEPFAFLSIFTLKEAYAEGWGKTNSPPVFNETDTFIERSKSRIEWLTTAVELDKKLIDRSRFNGLRFTYLSVYFAMVFIFPLIVLSVASQMFAEEYALGTIRTFLMRPIKRSQLFISKLVVVYLYMLSLLTLFLTVTLLIGILFSGYGNLALDSYLIGNNSGRIIMADGAVILLYISLPVMALSLLPLASLGIFLSVVKPQSATVIGFSSIIYFILFSLGDLPLFEDIRFLFFTTYMDVWTLSFSSPFPLESFVIKISALLLISVGLLMLTNFIHNKKDVFV